MIERILHLIDNSGYTDSYICREISLGNGIIGKWRKGLQKPSTEAIIKLASFFNVSTDYLLTGKEPSLNPLSSEDFEWIALIHKLPIEAQLEFRGELKGYIKRMEESVTTDNRQGKSLA